MWPARRTSRRRKRRRCWRLGRGAAGRTTYTEKVGGARTRPRPPTAWGSSTLPRPTTPSRRAGTTYTAAEYASRIAGILAGIPMAGMSSTYATLPELTAVTAAQRVGAAKRCQRGQADPDPRRPDGQNRPRGQLPDHHPGKRQRGLEQD